MKCHVCGSELPPKADLCEICGIPRRPKSKIRANEMSLLDYPISGRKVKGPKFYYSNPDVKKATKPLKSIFVINVIIMLYFVLVILLGIFGFFGLYRSVIVSVLIIALIIWLSSKLEFYENNYRYLYLAILVAIIILSIINSDHLLMNGYLFLAISFYQFFVLAFHKPTVVLFID